jgi:hypothetical protein
MILCDDVFDILTRGPFPSGEDSDGPVERHLEICPSCRRLADALRPAIELFEEAIGPEESRHLPRYWGDVATDVVETRETKIAAANPAARRMMHDWERRLDTARGLGRFLAAIAIGVAIAAVYDRARPHSLDPQFPDARRSGSAAPGGIIREATWQTQDLPPDCRVRRQVAMANGADHAAAGAFSTAWNQDCCLNCHRSPARSQAAEQHGQAPLAAAVRACASCHQ